MPSKSFPWMKPLARRRGNSLADGSRFKHRAVKHVPPEGAQVPANLGECPGISSAKNLKRVGFPGNIYAHCASFVVDIWEARAHSLESSIEP